MCDSVPSRLFARSSIGPATRPFVIQSLHLAPSQDRGTTGSNWQNKAFVSLSCLYSYSLLFQVALYTTLPRELKQLGEITAQKLGKALHEEGLPLSVL
jgi:hypothetical protein